MSSITTDLRAPRLRSAALRAAEGVTAGYIRSLAQTATRSPAQGRSKSNPERPAGHMYQCGAGRGTGMATRRRPALRRVPAPA